ncbi:Amino acid adenylation domain [Xenorhabdus poinarii G6]|uniref:Amino acid adenylation domain n=1 Tax=Xenorhabdus poinarii G6 TaxID=1354304 RepID=A0A068R2M8_9GAMM|nr:amino acid adenylation domain-containing protein [Xenorhabdus poinarii]CDG20375.1 Amino acid adenylation domain [Xenorhabdus poinarii G6]
MNNFVGLFEQLSQKRSLHPESIAVRDADSELNYQDFFQHIFSIYSRLQQSVNENTVCIGLFCEPSVSLVTAAWGILATGYAYLPLAPEYPEERLRYMIADSRVDVIFCQHHLKEKLQALVEHDVTIITENDIPYLFHLPESFNFMEAKDRERLAYVIYTSGSSGKPKGVMVNYQNISYQMCYLSRRFAFGTHSRILQKTPMSFDAAQWEILAPAMGVTLVIAPKGCYSDPDLMAETLLHEQITCLQCVPTLLQALVDQPLLQDCQALTHVFCGGEILTRNLARQLFQCLPNTHLINLYGPTECTINSSVYEVKWDTLEQLPDAVPIGYPVDDTRFYVLDPYQQPIAEGEKGELYISGVQVADGYLQRPDLTAERFLDNRFTTEPKHSRLYRTGDVVYRDNAGCYHFVGRVDNQIKLRGYRIELDEIRLAIERHRWVKRAAIVVNEDERTHYQNLIACIELDEQNAALMDQGIHSEHHQSKTSKQQVKAQLSNMGCRSEEQCLPFPVIELSGKEATPAQRYRAFSRKSYRFFEGSTPVTESQLLSILGRHQRTEQVRTLLTLSTEAFGSLLRNFGQFTSANRLLPKYAYASPGALYAAQMYLELHKMFGWPAGIYYYHPVYHRLYQVCELPEKSMASITIHFIGKRSAIEPIYQNNIQEVLEMEAGHMLGLFDELLPEYGLQVVANAEPGVLPQWYDGASSDYYLGDYRIQPANTEVKTDEPEFFVQVHAGGVTDMSAGMYEYRQGALHFLDEEVLACQHVIAINQQVYQRARFGIMMVNNHDNVPMHYVTLGRTLHRLQANPLGLGMMSAGYSSKSGNELPAANAMRALLARHGRQLHSCYFCIGGPLSHSQLTHDGMDEDRVHMQGPSEMLKADLAAQLPHYMIPNRVLVMENLPLMANGKVDQQLLNRQYASQLNSEKPFIAAQNELQQKLADIWCRVMKWDTVSVDDDFFESGGNSLTAVMFINQVNKALNIKLPMQILFQAPRIIALAEWIDRNNSKTQQMSRLVPFNRQSAPAIFCWPGLGGYPLSLKALGESLSQDHAFYGVQALGINEGEVPLSSIQQMAAADIAQIRKLQPQGPYTLWGYSFGARVAFEAAYQLEAAGQQVASLYLIAPGSPKTQFDREQEYDQQVSFTNPVFVAILFSVFARQVEGPLLERCLDECSSESDFIGFICRRFPQLQTELVERIVKIVKQTYTFGYNFEELQLRHVQAPITVIKAAGDHYSYLENSPALRANPPRVIQLKVGHYQLLQPESIAQLKTALFPSVDMISES